MDEPLAVRQRRLESQRAWRASTRGVGTVLAVGLFVLPLLWLPVAMLGLAGTHASFAGAFFSGGLMTAGWLVILGRHPHRKQRVLAMAGMLTSLAMFLSATSQLARFDFRSHAEAWLELAATALVLVGSSMWRSGRTPAITKLAWAGFALMLLARAIGGFAPYDYFIASATWILAGVAAFGMRAVRPDLPPGVPSAVLVHR